jgi:hypothetical protein
MLFGLLEVALPSLSEAKRLNVDYSWLKTAVVPVFLPLPPHLQQG